MLNVKTAIVFTFGSLAIAGSALSLAFAVSAGEPESERCVTLNYKRVKIETILADIRKQTGVRITVHRKAAGQALDLKVSNASVEETIDVIIAGKEWLWRKNEASIYEIWDRPGCMLGYRPRSQRTINVRQFKLV